ncbi:hypothetical protein B0F90DRAFT_1668364 [Multifurca ochricompacta]|uniref:RRM domain-containing protein n=1 Tax=Multifurca ochricompacta TaxID=376703 RepID=A0AAD4QKR7_9AGAM|nr:hypothetical protein B0F90DRAFT_1668364 [Multifurca ochricompacta]
MSLSTLGKRKIVPSDASDSLNNFHGSTLFVSNLPYTATSTDLKTLFSDIAPVRSAFVVLDRGTSTSKGVGYVSFTIPEDAKAAFDTISENGIILDGRSLRVEWAENKPGRAERGKKSSSLTIPTVESPARPKGHASASSRDPLAIRTIVISGLPHVDSKGLWKKIRKCEGAGDVKWPIKRDNGVDDVSTAAHVLFSSSAMAQHAVDKLHAHVFKGALLSVTLKKRLDGVVKQPHPSDPIPSRANRLIVRNLPFDITEQDLRAIFLPHGSIYSIDIPLVDAAEGGELSAPSRGKGFAFVWMWNRKEAEAAVHVCNGMQRRKREADKSLNETGRMIAVDWALSKNKWEEKKLLNEEMDSGSRSEQGCGDDAESLQSVVGELDGMAMKKHPDEDEEKGRPSLPQPEAGTTLFIRNIPFLATEDELRVLLRKFGPLRYARITIDAATGRSRGTGFVCFWNRADADKVVEQSNTIRSDMTGAIEAPLPTRNPFAMASILTPDPSAPSAQSLVLHGRTLDVVRAVTREEAGKLKEAGEKARRKADKRNMYLLREGVILPNTSATETLSSADVQKRVDSYNARRALLGSNPSLYVSKTRLSIRQIPTFVTERLLKRLATHAIQVFNEEVATGSRTSLSEEEMTRDEPADVTRSNGKLTPRVRQAKIVRQADRVDPLTGKGRSKRYGFLELREHADALRVLRWANNNPDVPPLLAKWWSAELVEEKTNADPLRAKRVEEMDKRGDLTKQPKGTLIVEFSIENTQVVRRRAARQSAGRGNYLQQKTVMGDLRRGGETQLNKGCLSKRSPAREFHPKAGVVGKIKGEG